MGVSIPLLGVNIDHVATVRQARRAQAPDILEAARAALRGGADSIVVHLREDRRHIQDADVGNLRKVPDLRLNLEMAASESILRVARVVHPDSVCFVPEKRQELTTEGGLDVHGNLPRLRTACQKMKSKGVRVSFFIDPDPAQVQAAHAAGADMVEIHTGRYANAAGESQYEELKKIEEATQAAQAANLQINAGHGLDYDNVAPIARIPGMRELNIGFSIVARAIFVGLEQAVREMKKLVVGG